MKLFCNNNELSLMHELRRALSRNHLRRSGMLVLLSVQSFLAYLIIEINSTLATIFCTTLAIRFRFYFDSNLSKTTISSKNLKQIYELKYTKIHEFI